MLMNVVEKMVINNPLRRAIQRHYEASLLLTLGGDVRGGRALEVGCGQGYGVALILDRFGATDVDAIDLDPEMVQKARDRLALRTGVTLQEASVTSIPFGDERYDAVFDFGIIHHVEDWRTAVTEIGRVLRPGGRFFFEEVTAHALARPTYRLLFRHPEVDRFTGQQFVAELERQGLGVGGRFVSRVFGDFVLGVAVKPPAEESGQR